MNSKLSVKKVIALVMALCMVVACLAACGSKEVTLQVNDMGTKTEIKAATDKTVAEALEAAGIKLGEKDETEPAKDTKITESLTDILVKRYAKVTVVFGDEKKEVELVGGTVDDAVKASGIKLEDGVAPDAPVTDYLKDGMTITLVKGVKVELTADGKTSEVATKAATVDEFLKEQKITLGENDEVSEKLDASLTDGMKIVVKRVEYKEETKTEEVDFKTEEKTSDSMASGTSEVTQEGVKGEKEVTYKVKYVDGNEESREAISEKVTKEPVNKIVTTGTYTAPAAGGDDDDSGSGGGKYEVSRQAMPDCDGSGHGYYIINYSDGSVEYEEY